jgi:two-component system response regulator NreC
VNEPALTRPPEELFQKTVNIVVVDDHPVTRHALRALLPTWNPSYEVVGEAATSREAVKVIEATTPDLVLLDLLMPGSNGVIAIRELRRSETKCRILVYTALGLPAMVIDAISAGADAYVLKTAGFEELVSAIEEARHGRRYISSSLRDQLGGALLHGRGLAALSVREREVFDLILNGHSNAELAARLFISVKTVETHRTRINRKLNVHSTGELIRFAAVNGLVSA